jgi:hypothetical protein
MTRILGIWQPPPGLCVFSFMIVFKLGADCLPNPATGYLLNIHKY